MEEPLTRCRSCQAEIFWIQTEAGRMMPCDPQVLTVITEEGRSVKGRITHFATCPQSKEWSRRNEGRDST